MVRIYPGREGIGRRADGQHCRFMHGPENVTAGADGGLAPVFVPLFQLPRSAPNPQLRLLDGRSVSSKAARAADVKLPRRSETMVTSTA